MNSIKQKWMMHKTYKRVQQLWEDYKAISDKDDLDQVVDKLTKFMDSFNDALNEWIASGALKNGILSSETIHEDLSDLFVNLVQIIVKNQDRGKEQKSLKVSDLINKALNVAETILKDERYQKVVSQTPGLIKSVLELLEKLDNKEGRKIALRILNYLSEDRTALGKLDGIKKILTLLVEGDAELTEEIVKIIKKFIPLQDTPVINSASTSAGTEFIASSVGKKFASLFGELKSTILNEVSKTFPKAKYDTEPPKGSLQFHFIPSLNDIIEAEKILDTKLQDRMRNDGSFKVEISLPDDQENKIYTEYLHVQGALSSLTATLSRSALTDPKNKLEIIDTIGRMIYKNNVTQNEFKFLSGYNVFKKALMELETETIIEQQETFLEDLFNIFFVLIIDGNTEALCENLDILNVLLDVFTEGTNFNFKRHIILVLQDLLIINSLNLVSFRKQGVIKKTCSGLYFLDNVIENENSDNLEFALALNNLLCFYHVLTHRIDPDFEVLEEYATYFLERKQDCRFSDTILESFCKILEDMNVKKNLFEFKDYSHVSQALTERIVFICCENIKSNLFESQKYNFCKIIALILENQQDLDQYRLIIENHGVPQLLYEVITSLSHNKSELSSQNMALFLLARIFEASFHKNSSMIQAPLEQLTRCLDFFKRKFSKQGSDSAIHSPLSDSYLNSLFIDYKGLYTDISISILSMMRRILEFVHTTDEKLKSSVLENLKNNGFLQHVLDLLHITSVTNNNSLYTECIIICCSFFESSVIRKEYFDDKSLTNFLNFSMGGMYTWAMFLEYLTNSWTEDVSIFRLILNGGHASPRLFGDVPLSERAFSNTTPVISSDYTYKWDNEKFFSFIIQPQLLFRLLPSISHFRKLYFTRQKVDSLRRKSADSVLNESSKIKSPLNSLRKIGDSVDQTLEQGSLTSRHSRHSRNSSWTSNHIAAAEMTSSTSHHSSRRKSRHTGRYFNSADSRQLQLTTNDLSSHESHRRSRSTNRNIRNSVSEVSGKVRSTQLTTDDAVNDNFSGSFSDIGHLNFAGGSDIEVGLKKFILRNEMCAELLLSSLLTLEPEVVSIHREFYVIVYILLKNNAYNVQLLASQNTLMRMFKRYIQVFQLKMVKGNSTLVDFHALSPYKEFLVLLAKYDIKEEFVFQAIKLALDNSSAAYKEIGFEWQIQFLDVLSLISERKEPRYYLSLTSTNQVAAFSPFLNKASLVKSGFSLVFWIRILDSIGKENTLFSFIEVSHKEEKRFLNFSFVKVVESGTSKKPTTFKICLACESFFESTEKHVFDNFDFMGHRDEWVMVGLVYSRSGLNFYVNGDVIQSGVELTNHKNLLKFQIQFMPQINLTNTKINEEEKTDQGQQSWFNLLSSYFSSVDSVKKHFDSATDAVVDIEKNPAYFAAVLTNFTLWDIVLDVKFYKEMYESGLVEQDKTLRLLTDSKVVYNFVLFETHLSQSTSSLTQSRLPQKKCSFNGALGKGNSFHDTLSLSDAFLLKDELNVSLLLPFIEFGPAQQSKIFKIVTNLFYKNDLIKKQFESCGCWDVLHHLLSYQNSSSDLTVDIFDGLMDMITENTEKFINVPCLILVLDLLMYARDEVQIKVFRTFVDLCTKHPQNVIVWRQELGLFYSFELLLLYNEINLRSTLLRLINILLKDLNSVELSQIIEFLVYDRRQNLENKHEILNLLYQKIVESDSYLEYLKTFNTIPVFTGLLDTNNERFRIVCIKILSLLFNYPSSKAQRIILNKVGAFDAITLFLSPYQLTPEVGDTLIKASMGFHRPVNDKEAALDRSDQVLIHPELIKVLFDLVAKQNDIFPGNASNDVCVRCLSKVRSHLTLENIKILWEKHNWLWWLDDLANSMINQDTSIVIDSICQKMLVYDIQRRNSFISKNRGQLSENDDFQLRMSLIILSYFCENPCLPSDTCSEIIKSLVILYRYMDENISQAKFYAKFLITIHHLTCHNNSNARTLMKSSGLLDLSNESVIRLLNSSDIAILLTSNDFLSCFPLDQLADHQKFRENNGLLFFLRLFFKSQQDHGLQEIVLAFICNYFLPFEENRKIVSRIIEDAEVLEKLFFINSEKTSTTSYSLSNGEFISWYYSLSPEFSLKRTTIEQRIELFYSPTASFYAQKQEKVLAKKNKRLTSLKDKKFRAQEKTSKLLVQLKDKINERLHRLACDYQDSIDALRIARHERRRNGQEVWIEMKKNAYETILKTPSLV